jgi:hypothetical protein
MKFGCQLAHFHVCEGTRIIYENRFRSRVQEQQAVRKQSTDDRLAMRAHVLEATETERERRVGEYK